MSLVKVVAVACIFIRPHTHTERCCQYDHSRRGSSLQAVVPRDGGVGFTSEGSWSAHVVDVWGREDDSDFPQAEMLRKIIATLDEALQARDVQKVMFTLSSGLLKVRVVEA